MQFIFLFVGNCNIVPLRNGRYTNSCKANLDDNEKSFLYWPTYLSEPQFSLRVSKMRSKIYINIFSVLILLLRLLNESAIVEGLCVIEMDVENVIKQLHFVVIIKSFAGSKSISV